MIDIDGLDYFYGSKKVSNSNPRSNLSSTQLPLLLELFGTAQFKKGENPSEEEIKRIDDLIDSLNFELYEFVRGFRKTTVSAGGG